ncbi:hypothetical protein GV827_20815 [Sulfitobacter sp. JBTF-M27]|uniref:DUF6854 domain-containing protein n=1 Tax=Sulfitobacter sediminilitoris TaxID=2698830 RepID=A0A6P0CFW4_9RHOB|nr:hypothetical protein [Sulfitobacter sediminilitoris]NEK24817.1 hypothetical protein [Sulfitobacter sediminilitoris]
MTATNYTMVTVASCEPSFLNQALKHTGALAEELKASAGAIITRYGVLATGEHAGSMMLMQGYSELNGIDAAFGVYNKSADYQALIGSGKVNVTLRNILKVEPLELENQSTDVPAYGVLTRWGSADSMVDRMRGMVHLFEDNGAMFMRYWTIMTGSHAGRRLLAVGYPSMDAIEKTYNALRGSDDYNSMVSDIDIDFRNIVRIAG